MKTFSKEKRQKTDQALLTSPTSLTLHMMVILDLEDKLVKVLLRLVFLNLMQMMIILRLKNLTVEY